MKGTVLAGGTGSRLDPTTRVASVVLTLGDNNERY